MNNKEIILDIMDETAEIKLETKGYKGTKCLEESEFLKKALGETTNTCLHAVAHVKGKEVKRVYKPICG